VKATRRRLTAHPFAFLLAMEAYAATAFALEPAIGRGGQFVIAALSSVILVAAARDLPPADIARVAAVVIVATLGEVVFSSWLGLFTYRWGNIPPFVPPGHGLIYLTGLRLARSPSLLARPRAVTAAAGAAALSWAVALALFAERPDALGLVGLAVLTFFLLRGRRPLLYAAIFFVAAPLELYATAIGTWHWAATVPLLGIPSANPPCAIPAGYILFDAIALRLAPALRELARRAGRPRTALRRVPAL
jgi:hypothetical protein